MNYISIGSTPHDEPPCAQIGDPDYDQKARAECKRFLEQIGRHYPEPAGGYLKIKGFSHDFGKYYEVVAVFNDCDEEATLWALSIEADEKGVLSEWE
jgi:hypothetical protein